MVHGDVKKREKLLYVFITIENLGSIMDFGHKNKHAQTTMAFGKQVSKSKFLKTKPLSLLNVQSIHMCTGDIANVLSVCITFQNCVKTYS